MNDSNSAQVKMFEDIENKINREIVRSKTSIQPISLLSHISLNQQRQSMYVTNYGKLFLDAVIESNK